MADATTSKTSSSPLRALRGMRWMTDRQLDAYLQTRDTLRRLRAAAALTPSRPQRSPPGQTV